MVENPFKKLVKHAIDLDKDGKTGQHPAHAVGDASKGNHHKADGISEQKAVTAHGSAERPGEAGSERMTSSSESSVHSETGDAYGQMTPRLDVQSRKEISPYKTF